jgi:hypothetical protein
MSWPDTCVCHAFTQNNKLKLETYSVADVNKQLYDKVKSPAA